MLRNYFKIAFRNLWKNKAFSAINIVGLAAGLSVCLLILLYVFNELGYDRYNQQASRIYRLDADLFFNGTQLISATSPKPLAPTLVKEYPQIAQMVRISDEGNILVKKGGDNLQDNHAVFADSTIFKVFTLPVVAGDALTALNQPNAVVIDESTAKKYFNSTNVIGKALCINNTHWCQVTAVIKDIPAQSHFHFKFIRPFSNSNQRDANTWTSNNAQSYVLVQPGVTKADLQQYVDKTIGDHLMKELEEVLHTTPEDLKKAGSHFRYVVMPLTDIHLHSNKGYELEANGDINYVYIFSAIAGLILLIACVNFMNLSTARSANRAKEVGIRKVSGSLRWHLIVQFLTESVLLSFIALLLALLISALALPWFNQLSGKEIRSDALLNSRLLPALIGIVFMVGCIAGSYPAFYLSSFQPIQVLKGKLATGFKNSWLRSSLVVFQFCISIMLIIGTIVIYDQLHFLHDRNVGFNREQVLVLHNTASLHNKVKTFRDDLLLLPGVKDATVAGNLPTSEPGSYDQNGWFRNASLDIKNSAILSDFSVDEHYLPTLGIQLAAGRNFSRDYPSDSTALLLNETAVRLLGLKDPLHTELYAPINNERLVPYHIIGVVKDFNYSTMHEKVAPMVMRLNENWDAIAVRIAPGNISGITQQIEAKWKSIAPGQPFSFTFMDNDFDNIYKAEQHTGTLFTSFAIFAIIIACLGLFGLVTYAAEQRTKEIGIRKVLGAKIGNIVTILSRDFTRLVIIAAVIAFPLAWWAMNKWLESFAYRTHISWWMFVMAGCCAMTIAWVTIGIQTIRAALVNPVKSLKSE